ncbi:MAG: DUF6973 domain-containing protein [Bacteroidia bacterium]
MKKIRVNLCNLWQKNLGAVMLLLALPMLVSAQSFSSLSKYEKRWAFFHPFASLKIKKHKDEILAVYKEVKEQKLLDMFENGGQLDAFRHVFSMAYLSKFVSVKKLRKFGKAHEKGNYLQYLKDENENGELPDSLSSVMDLKNNDVGLLLKNEIKKLSAQEVKQKVIADIKSGKAFIIKRNADGLYVDCNGNIISRSKPYKRWNLPKCLVPSNN